MIFQAESYGKCIIAGEHSVLRGQPAVVFPVRPKFMKLEVEADDGDFTAQFLGHHGEELKVLFFGLLEQTLERLGKKRKDLSGALRIESELPLGAGLGASAAICVLVSKWMNHLGYLATDQLYHFSRSLEDIFHGESSGVDIAMALEGEGIRFCRPESRELVAASWNPTWFVSYSGQRGSTRECVSKVKELLAKKPKLGEELDQQMGRSAELSQQALRADSSSGLPLLVEAVKMGESCFKQWGLIYGQLEEHQAALYELGALAVKPTGSGGGGYCLSLWEKEPTDVPFELIPVS